MSSDINLSNEQSRVLFEIISWFNSRLQPFWRLSGPAGSGKTSILKYLLSSNDLVLSKQIAVLAYTHKAAGVLRSKGIDDAGTIHSFMYKFEEDNNGIFNFWKKPLNEIRDVYGLIIVDEAGMINGEMRRDLESYGIPVLYVGDHHQLPAINATDDDLKFMENSESQLIEIHRQALDSAIIRLSIDIRLGKFLKFGKYGDGVWIVDDSELTDDLLLKTDQVIVGKNTTRMELNRYIRKLKGYKPFNMPDFGEQLMVLENYHDKGLFNSNILTFESEGFNKDKKVIDSIYENVLFSQNTQLTTPKNPTKATHPVTGLEEYKSFRYGKLYFDKSNPEWAADPKFERKMIKSCDLIKVDFAEAITCHKCITGDTLVVTSEGIIPLSNLDNGADTGRFKEFDKDVFIYNGDELEKVDSFFNNGISDLVKITTDSGYHLKVTHGHRMVVYDSMLGGFFEKFAKDITNEDVLPLAYNSNIFPTEYQNLESILNKFELDEKDIRENTSFTLPIELDEKLGKLLGFLTADGFLDDRKFHYTKSSKSTVEKVKLLAEEIFNIPKDLLVIKKDKKFEHYILAVHSLKICRFLSQFNGLQSKNKSVNELIMCSPKTVQAAYLSALFEDGYVNIKKGKFDHIEFSTKYPKLYYQVQSMLLNFGIVSNLCIRGGEKQQHYMYIYSYHAQKFYHEIGFISNEKQEMLKLCFSIKNKYGLKGFKLQSIFKRLIKEFNLSIGLDDTTQMLSSKTRLNISLNVVDKFVQQYKSNFKISQNPDFVLLSSLIDRIYLEKVSKIESITSENTFCLKMSESGIFSQNGIIAGNSQGSSYRKPIVYEESIFREKKLHAKWLYTAVTRAEEKVILRRQFSR